MNELQFEKPPTKSATIPKLIPPPHVKIPGITLAIHSFTGLSKGIKKLTTELNTEAAPHDFDNAIKSAHTLPSGSETGNLLHQILEKADFSDEQKIKELVHSEIALTQFAEWEPVIFSIVHKASNAMLVQSNNPFCLKEILQKNMYRETEFLYPIKAKIVVNELEFNSGFLKGVIDLVFVQEGKYYILDWKSNWLGHGVENYERASLESAMKNNDYYLQASVYAGALQRYLGIVDRGTLDDFLVPNLCFLAWIGPTAEFKQRDLPFPPNIITTNFLLKKLKLKIWSTRPWSSFFRRRFIADQPENVHLKQLILKIWSARPWSSFFRRRFIADQP